MKTEIVNKLSNLRSSHLEWIVHADNIVKGISEVDAKSPLECTRCEFGQWYYSVGQKIKNLPTLKKIAKLDEEFHAAYKIIYYESYDRRSNFKQRQLESFLKKPVSKGKSSLPDLFEVLRGKFILLHNETKSLEEIVCVMNEKLFLKDRFNVNENL